MSRGLLIVALLAAYALPLYWPPAGAALLVPTPDTPLLARLFPGVPAWWIISRLVCLALAAALLPRLALPAPTAFTPDAAAPQPPALRNAMAAAAIVACAGFFVSSFNRPLQLLYIAALFLPTVILLLDERRQRSSPVASNRRALASIAVVVLLWLVIRVPMALHSPRIASAVDMTASFDAVGRAAAADVNVINGAVQSGGITALHLVLDGAGILGWSGIPVTIAAVQWIHLFWAAAAAFAVGLVAWRLAGAAAATVATAAFLFSPYILATSYYVAAVYLGSLFAAVALLLYLQVADRGSNAMLVLLGAIGGIAVTHPGLGPIPLGLFALALLSMWRQPRRAYVPLLAALLVFAAAALPALPATRNFDAILNTMTSGRIAWSALEAGLFGQVATHLVDFGSRIGQPGPFDVQLAALLTPVAIPRTAVRLLGDIIADPLSATLSVLGIAACLRWCRSDTRARGLLALLALALLPLFASTYDRPSITRAFVLPLPLALLAALGCDQLRRLLRLDPRLLAGGMTAAVAISGLMIFDVVNPRILPAAATTIAVEALSRTSPQPRTALILSHPQWDQEEVQTYANIPASPLAARPFTGPEALQPADEPEPDVVLWSPGLEESRAVAAAICARWPQASLYAFFDATHSSRVFAALPRGGTWSVDLPPERLRAGDCASGIETEDDVAQRVLAEAQRLREAGQPEAAVTAMRAAARRSFVAVELFDTLARADLEAGDLDEAAYWALRATLPKSGRVAPWITRAEVEAARGRLHRAIFDATRGLWWAKEQHDSAMQARLEALIAGYEARLEQRPAAAD